MTTFHNSIFSTNDTADDLKRVSSFAPKIRVAILTNEQPNGEFCHTRAKMVSTQASVAWTLVYWPELPLFASPFLQNLISQPLPSSRRWDREASSWFLLSMTTTHISQNQKRVLSKLFKKEPQTFCGWTTSWTTSIQSRDSRSLKLYQTRWPSGASTSALKRLSSE